MGGGADDAHSIPVGKALAVLLQKVATEGAEAKVLAPLAAALQVALSSLGSPGAHVGADKPFVLSLALGGAAGYGAELPAGGCGQVQQQPAGGSVSALQASFDARAKEGGDGGVPRRCGTMRLSLRASPY